MADAIHATILPTQPDFGDREPIQEPDPCELSLLRLALNQVDYGMIVLDADSAMVQFANAPGRAALEDSLDAQGRRRHNSGLYRLHGRVIARRSADAEPLRRALERSRNGLRGLLSLGEQRQSSIIAVVPLSAAPLQKRVAPAPSLGSALGPSFALLVFAKQHLCDDSTMALFARERGLTSAEGQVLAQVCKGLRPAQIADNHGVQISTIRTQLRSIRAKTYSDTIRDLVHKVSVLPPMALHLTSQAIGY